MDKFVKRFEAIELELATLQGERLPAIDKALFDAVDQINIKLKESFESMKEVKSIAVEASKI